MFKSIPASNIAAIYPAVLGAGGNPLGLNANLLSPTALYASNEYFSADSVSSAFGQTSDESTFATVYFNGYTGASTRPDSLFITRYDGSDYASRLISSSLVGITLEDLKAFTGGITLSIDGVSTTSSAVDLSTATSFSNAAQIIGTALDSDGTKLQVTYSSTLNAFVFLTVSKGESSTISFATGTLAELLRITQDTGAYQENGGLASTGASLLKRMTAYASNFATVSYVDSLMTLDLKKDIAKVLSAQNGRYWFVAYDTDPQSTTPNSPTSFGGWVIENALNGITPIFGGITEAALACGYGASVNYEEFNGRTTMAFRSQDGIAATVTDEQTAEALVSNGYSFYGAWATANDRFIMLGNGAVSGDYKWVDNYLFQVFLNSQFQLAYVNMLKNYKSIPYNTDGEAIIRATCQDPIDQGVNFGGIRSGIELTNQQKDLINREFGTDVSGQLYAKGWALYVQMPSAQARANRESPIIKFFYTDGSSIQRIEMTSTNVQ